MGHFSNAEIQVSCKGPGTVEVHQTGSTFVGGLVQTRTCARVNEAGESRTSALPITEGEVDGTSVSFQIGTCSYTGTLGGSNVMTGHTTCALTILGQRYRFEGQWHAGR